MRRVLPLFTALLLALPAQAAKDKQAKKAFKREFGDRVLTLRVDVRHFVEYDARIATTAGPGGVSHPNSQEPVQFPAGTKLQITDVYAMPNGNLRLAVKAPGFSGLKAIMLSSTADADAQMRKYMGYVVLEGPHHRQGMSQLFEELHAPHSHSPDRDSPADRDVAVPMHQPKTADWTGGPFDLEWGDSLAAAEERIGLPLRKASGFYATPEPTSIGRLPAYVSVHFDESGRLWRAQVLFAEKHSFSSYGEYREDFFYAKELLESKYGPGEQHLLWLNDLYRDDPQDWVSAVSLGHLHWAWTWESRDTSIELGLLGGDRKVTHRVLYTSKELEGGGKAGDTATAADKL